MEKKVYRILSKNNKSLLILLSLLSLVVVSVTIFLLQSNNTVAKDLFYFIGGSVLFQITLVTIGYNSRLEINASGIKCFSLFKKKRLIQWNEIKTVGVYTFNTSTYKFKMRDLKDAHKPFYWGAKFFFIAAENVSENELLNLHKKNAITFGFYKDVFDAVVLGYNDYLNERDKKH